MLVLWCGVCVVMNCGLYRDLELVGGSRSRIRTAVLKVDHKSMWHSFPAVRGRGGLPCAVGVG